MCFSDEPMIAIYGEFGIRLEDCLYMTTAGPKFFTEPSPAIDRRSRKQRRALGFSQGPSTKLEADGRKPEAVLKQVAETQLDVPA